MSLHVKQTSPLIRRRSWIRDRIRLRLEPRTSGVQQLPSARMPSCLQDSNTIICVIRLWAGDWAQEKLGGRPSLDASLSTYLRSHICLASGNILFSASWNVIQKSPLLNLGQIPAKFHLTGRTKTKSNQFYYFFWFVFCLPKSFFICH